MASLRSRTDLQSAALSARSATASLAALLVLGSCGSEAPSAPAPAAWPVSVEQPPQVQPRFERVVLVTIDTLRADHLSCYGYPRRTTPFLDSLAERGVRFTRAFAAVSHT